MEKHWDENSFTLIVPYSYIFNKMKRLIIKDDFKIIRSAIHNKHYSWVSYVIKKYLTKDELNKLAIIFFQEHKFKGRESAFSDYKCFRYALSYAVKYDDSELLKNLTYHVKTKELANSFFVNNDVLLLDAVKNDSINSLRILFDICHIGNFSKSALKFKEYMLFKFARNYGSVNALEFLITKANELDDSRTLTNNMLYGTSIYLSNTAIEYKNSLSVLKLLKKYYTNKKWCEQLTYDNFLMFRNAADDHEKHDSAYFLWQEILKLEHSDIEGIIEKISPNLHNLHLTHPANRLLNSIAIDIYDQSDNFISHLKFMMPLERLKIQNMMKEQFSMLESGLSFLVNLNNLLFYNRVTAVVWTIATESDKFFPELKLYLLASLLNVPIFDKDFNYSNKFLAFSRIFDFEYFTKYRIVTLKGAFDFSDSLYVHANRDHLNCTASITF